MRLPTGKICGARETKRLIAPTKTLLDDSFIFRNLFYNLQLYAFLKLYCKRFTELASYRKPTLLKFEKEITVDARFTYRGNMNF